jgi:sugar lactone lactonase YvrE
MEAELLLATKAELGEGPCWDARAGVLRWVDVHAGRLHTFDPDTGEDQALSLGEPIGCCAPRRGGGLVLALRSGFYTLDLAGGNLTWLATPEQVPGNRFNDGKCDPAGRFLAGSMDEAEQAASGTLYSCLPNGSVTSLLTGLRISNGLTWSPDNRTFYFIDTPTRTVMAYDYYLETGVITHQRPVVFVPETAGWPDGMTSDSEGMLWIALWGGAAVSRWDPGTGKMITSFPIPALHVSSCIFGGANLAELYITSARKGLTAAELQQYQLSGGLFRLETGVQGMPTFEFGGGLE